MHSIKNLHLMCTPMCIILTIAKRGRGGDVLLLINIVNHVSSQPQNCIYNPNTKQINNNNKVTNMSIQ